jgi:ABC-type uncharacterized transport system auxiliary subunit
MRRLCIHLRPIRPCLPVATAAFGAALWLSGCLSRPVVVGQSFALQSPPIVSAATKGSGWLTIRSVEVSPLFESKCFVYRTGEDSYERDPHAAFLVPPARCFRMAVRGWLHNSGVFREVLEPGSLVKPDRLLEVYVTELYGDFRKPGRPSSVLSIGLVFLTDDEGSARRVYLQKDYTRSISLKQNTAAELVAGWDKALAEIMAEVVTDLATAGQPAAQSK